MKEKKGPYESLICARQSGAGLRGALLSHGQLARLLQPRYSRAGCGNGKGKTVKRSGPPATSGVTGVAGGSEARRTVR